MGLRGGTELETPSCGDGYGVAWRYLHRRGRFSGGFGRAAPDLAAAFQHVPGFLYAPVPHRARDLPGRQRYLHEAGAGSAMAVVNEQAYFRAVRSDGVELAAAAAQRRQRLLAYHRRILAGIPVKAESRPTPVGAKRPDWARGLRDAPEFAIGSLSSGLAAFPFEEILEALFN